MKTLYGALALLLLLSAGCKKSLIGSHMSVTRNNTNLQFGEVNIFTPNRDGRNDRFSGPVHCHTTTADSVVSYSLKIGGSNVAYNSWDGAGKSDNVYDYEANYTTVGGSARVTGLVRLWRSGKVPCDETSLYRFPEAYDSYNCGYLAGSASDEHLPCK